MSALSSLFLLVALTCLVMSANTLECWFGNDLSKFNLSCKPETVFCSKADCVWKKDQIGIIEMRCEANSSLCDGGSYEDEAVQCTNVRCCRGDFCNGVVPDRVVHFTVLMIAGIFSGFFKWF
ncbi:hypothetical protein niasHT_012398 [Heterodera trifolii]|uniref:Uncharacterized protein n=1 Tax=Heterodera trifolii TaxID=157864 RepID=A0ABD2L738_9BILA